MYFRVTMSPSKWDKNESTLKLFYKVFRGYLIHTPFSIVHCLNKYIFNFIRKEYYVSKSRLKIAKNIIDINRFSPLKDKNQITKLRRSLNLPLKNKIILYAGYLNERKGLDLLIELGVYLKKSIKIFLL